MPTEETPKEERITISFSVNLEEYKALSKRLPGFGDKTLFFRTVVRKFLDGELLLSSERKF